MARLMNLDEAIEHCLEKADCTMCGAEHKQLAEWLQELKKYREQPTVDAVEVVRCKDCGFNVANIETDLLDATDYSDITCSYFMTDGMEPDDFCSRGKKMDGGDKE